ncbi:hypothetical protein NC652_028716 [Populus alba x Populus x berolinensis]|nr:hypothetical protein NC652_028716 [Populus alba x Populus x berolinensis]
MELDKLKFSIVLTIFSAMTVLYAVAYDPLDPHGSINIKWDILSWTPDGYVGGPLGWTWAKKEVIWSMVGAQATDQGDCSNFKGNIPHCCTRNPTVVDLLPGVPKTQQYSDLLQGWCFGILGTRTYSRSFIISAQCWSLWYIQYNSCTAPEFLFAWSQDQAIRAVQQQLFHLQFSSQVMGSEKHKQ